MCTCALLRVTQHTRHLNNNGPGHVLVHLAGNCSRAAEHTGFLQWKDGSNLTRQDDVSYISYGPCNQGPAYCCPADSKPLPFFPDTAFLHVPVQWWLAEVTPLSFTSGNDLPIPRQHRLQMYLYVTFCLGGSIFFTGRWKLVHWGWDYFRYLHWKAPPALLITIKNFSRRTLALYWI